MKHFYVKNSFAPFLAFAPLLLMAQDTPQFRLDQHGRAICAVSPVEHSVTTSISQNGHKLQLVREVITADSFYE
jgi:hypothetical protein